MPMNLIIKIRKLKTIVLTSILIFFAFFQFREPKSSYISTVYAKSVETVATATTDCAEQIRADFRLERMGKFQHFKNDLRHSSNKLQYRNGDVFTGTVKKGRKNGFGTYRYISGETYTGNFLNDQRHGLGRMVHDDGRIYVGLYFHDKKNGKGTLYRSNGKEIRSGIWQDGRFNRTCP